MTMNLGNARNYGSSLNQARSNTAAWKEHAQDLEAAYQKLSDKHIQLQGEFNKVSQKYNEISNLLQWIEEDPGTSAISSIQRLKATTLSSKAKDENWTYLKIREENYRLMAEGEYDYRVLADPSYRLNNAAEALLTIADNSDDAAYADKIKMQVTAMMKTGKCRDDDEREKFISERIAELQMHCKYTNPMMDTVPVLGSIPALGDRFEKNAKFKLVETQEHIGHYLIR